MEEHRAPTVIVLPTEDQQLLDQFPGLFRPRYDLLDMAMRLALSRNHRKRQLAEAEDGCETVVQLMRDTAGKGADRFPPRSLPTPGFDLLTIGHIDDRPECAGRLPQRIVAIKRSQRTKPDMPHNAVWPDETVLDLRQAIAHHGTSCLDGRAHPVPIIGMNQLEVALP
jgi:hypothetical protein